MQQFMSQELRLCKLHDLVNTRKCAPSIFTTVLKGLHFILSCPKSAGRIGIIRSGCRFSHVRCTMLGFTGDQGSYFDASYMCYTRDIRT
eukprot:scaffold228868_cov38-Prasinocladus_malaysianus.AAC.1